MKYENLKPTLTDQVKWLLDQANKTHTVPHGVKTVNPGEGLQLLSEDGSEIFWDWETAAEYNTRISEGQAAIAEAEAALAQTRLDLDAAGERITDARLEIAGAVTQAAEAKQLVETTASNLAGVDQRLTTTTGELSTLKTTVGDVSAAVTASETKASAALAKSVQAQASADGKTRITRSTSPASEAGTAAGDTHFVMSSMGGGGRVVRQQRWDGATWQDETVSHEVIASLDLGKATVGELDGGRIRANTVTADRLLVGLGDNYAPDPYFQAPQAWNMPLWIDPLAAGYRTRGALLVPAGTTQRGAYMATRGNLPASRRVRFSVWVSSPTSLQVDHVRIFMRVYKPDGSWVFGVPTFVYNTQFIAADTWGQVTGEFVAPEDGATFMVGLFVQAAATNVVKFSEMQVIGQTQGELIVDGSVTARQVNAESVAGAVGQFVKVQAVNVEVTEALAARVVNAMATNTKNLVVTESAILQHSTLLGTTVAERLNVTKLLVGRDAILTGTVDVAQLNVTTSMSAEIVKAMDIQARRGIFTEGLTAAETTLLGTTVAENLNAGTVASRIMTGGLLQTTAASNRGVKIDNSGIKAWDDSGSQTVNISGTANYIVGEFSTAPDKQRVRLRSRGAIAAADFFGSNDSSDHLGVWHTSSSVLANTVSKIVSMPGETQETGNPGLLLYPTRGEFAFAGRWAVDSPTLKFWDMSNFQGLTGGGWADLTWTYANPFGSDSKRMPYLSVEARSGAECVPVVIEQTNTYIKVRVVNKSSNPSGPLYVRCVVFNINSEVYSTYG